MNSQQKQGWREKNQRLNAGYEPKLGDRFVDSDGHHGVVVKVRSPEDEEDHGTLYLWQEDRTEYGSDNCEHYALTNWHAFLRRVE